LLQLPDELFVSLLRCSAFLRRLLRRDLAALFGRLIAVPPKRVAARKEVATLVAKVDFQGVLLPGIAMALELLEVLQLRVWAETALDLLDDPTCKVGL